MNTCEFYYIRRRDNLPIQTKGIEKSWSELQREFGRTGPGYPGATYYKRISTEGPELFAVVNKKWVLYQDGGKWHRYLSACDIKFDTIQNNKLNFKGVDDEQEDESWIILSEKDGDTELIDHYIYPLEELKTIPFRFRIVTWNVGNSQPNCDTFIQLSSLAATNKIQPDLIVFGFQEISNRLLGSDLFHKKLKECLTNKQYVEIIADYVGSSIVKPIWLYIYISTAAMHSQRVKFLKWGKESTLKVYQDKFLESIIGYKGVIASRIQIDNSINLVFANMHLPAGEGKIEKRCKLLSKFLQTYQMYHIQDDYMFFFGDQNWRTIDSLSIANILQAIDTKDYKIIQDNDELIRMRQDDSSLNTERCINTFVEAPITFPPTYKYIVNSDQYQTNKNNEDRRPSYTDRILVSKLNENLQIMNYSTISHIKLSDHRPVFADMILYQDRNTEK